MIKNQTQCNLGNARYVYSKSTGYPFDLRLKCNQINKWLELHQQIRPSGSGKIIYFFTSPNDEDFDVTESWVGLEIIGLPQLDDLPGFEVTDFDSTILFRCELSSACSMESPPQLRNAFNAGFDAASRVLGDIANTWRLRIEVTAAEKLIAPKLFIEFYPSN